MQFLSRFRLTLLRSLLELLCVSNLHRAGLTCQSVDICLELLCPPQVENRLIKKTAQEQLCGPVHLGLTLWLHWKAWPASGVLPAAVVHWFPCHRMKPKEVPLAEAETSLSSHHWSLLFLLKHFWSLDL